MGVLFRTEQYQPLLEKSDSYARLFIKMTKVVAEVYELQTPLSEVVNDECWVNEEQFCLLVEKAFAAPVDLFYSWAQKAAGMYEVIKGRRFDWKWSINETPLTPFAPLRQIGLMPPN